MRSINDFLWLDQVANPICYPKMPAILRNDEVVLGLTYEEMFSICLELHIKRDYQSLGDYINAKGFDIVLNISNEEYGFDDQEIFSVFAVIASPTPCFYHLDHHWNHKIIVDQLRFRSTLSEETPNPQYVFEIPYLALSVQPSEFVLAARKDEKLEHLVFDPASYSYLPTVCPVDGVCSIKRLYLYGADKSGVSFQTLDSCLEVCPSIKGRLPVTSASYFAGSSSLAMGFAGKFYLCADFETAEKTVDEYSYLPYEAAFLPGEENDDCKDGSYFAQGDSSIRVLADLSGQVVGELPLGDEECLLSKQLYEKWGEPTEVYASVEVGSEVRGSTYVRDMVISPIKVTGYKESDYDAFFVNSDWSVDFYLDALSVSSFLLEPMGCVFYFASQEEADAGAVTLEKAFPDYVFASPAKEISDSIASTLRYIGSILNIFSIIALVMSALLFLVVMMISVTENEGEARLFRYIGISERDIRRVFRTQAYSFFFLALVSGVGMLAVSEMVAKLYIAKIFGSKINLSIPLRPIGLTIAASAVFLLTIIMWINIHLYRKNRMNRG